MVPASTTRRGFLAASGTAAAGSVLADEASAEPKQAEGRKQSSLGDAVSDAVEQALSASDADGATIAVVDEDEPTVTAGFGHAYRNPKAPVDPAETLFRIASVSKAVTFTAAMALVDEGTLEPDAPIAAALDSVSVPDRDAYGDPVTLAHLATHTAGFGQRAPGQVARDADDIRTLPESLRANDPDRITAPGERALYTNYNAGLAGQAVADTLETEFASAIERLVFDPLGMETSTFEPLPPALVGGDDEAAATVNWFSEMVPASGMSATATEMARFVRALVSDGSAADGRILSPEAVTDLHRQWHTPDERLAGASFGMERQRRNGTLVVGHGGGVPDFSTDLRLVPEAGSGLFVSAHGAEADEVQAAATEAFLEQVAPVSSVEPPDDDTVTRASELTGRYKARTVTTTTSFEKVLYGATRPATTVAVEDGTLVTDDGNTTHRWVEIEPLVFRRTDGADTLVFEQSGGETYSYRATASRSPLERVPWYGQSRHHATLALVAGLAVLSGAAGWPAAAGWRRLRGGGAPEQSLTRTRLVAGSGVAVLLLFTLVALFGFANRWVYEPPPGFDLLFALPLVASALSLAALLLTGRAWREGDWSLGTSAHSTLVAVGLAALCWLCWYWNLLQIPV